MTNPDHTALLAIRQRYFEQHPETKDGVLKAYFAFHVEHFRLEPWSHNFTSGDRHSRCIWCNRSRQDVRYDDLPPTCEHRPATADDPIEKSILEEELLADDLRQRSTAQILKLTQGTAMSGQLLATLHGTYGFDPEIVATVLGNIDEKHITDYHKARELERERSKAAHQTTVITVRNPS